MSEIQIINFIDLSQDELLYVLKMRNHPGVRKWMCNQEVIPLKNHLRFVDELKIDRKNLYFGIKNKGVIIGVFYLNDIDYKNMIAEIGLYSDLYNSSRGIGGLILNSAINYAKEMLKLNALYLKVLKNNSKAIHLYEKFGFENIKKNKCFGEEFLYMYKVLR